MSPFLLFMRKIDVPGVLLFTAPAVIALRLMCIPWCNIVPSTRIWLSPLKSACGDSSCARNTNSATLVWIYLC